MKTLKFLAILVVLTAIATVTTANTYIETNYVVTSSYDLPTTIKKMVKADFVNTNNYFHQNNIYSMKEEVMLFLKVNDKNELEVIKTVSESESASEYLHLLLDNSKLDVENVLINKVFRLKVKIDYRT
ncbi:MAG: hypothetical protein PF541_13740 [Prolixibacteraceae bacterium]|jgi:hypothetical protein|nr:hypothetical protein [Prolixibacteraceae bacterium]